METGQETRVITAADVEKAIWELTGWQGNSAAVESLLVIINAYAAGLGVAQAPDALRESWYHSLVVMAEHLLDTGGRMRMVPAFTEPAPLPVRIAGNAARVTQGTPTQVNSGGQLKCKECELWKDPEDFYLDRKAASGRKGKCKACEQQRSAGGHRVTA